MEYYFKKGERVDVNIFMRGKDFLNLTFEDIHDINLSPGELIAKMITHNPLARFFGYNEKNMGELLYCILKRDKSLIPNYSISKEEPFLKMNSHYIEKLIDVYDSLMLRKNDSRIVIETDKDNLMDYLEYIKDYKGNYTVYSRSITLYDYYELFKDIDLDKYSNIIIDYQDYTSPVNVKMLFDIAKINKEVIDVTINENLSPLEQIIYVYDRLKRREYKKNDKDYSSSRDIDKILKGDNIVCIGYANLFSALLSSFGISNKVVANKEGRHARNIVHLIDSKYNIDSIFFFDVTGDAKKSYDNNYLYKYNYFAITLEDASIQMEEPLYNLLKKDYEEISNILLKGNVNDTILIEDAFELYKHSSFEVFLDYVHKKNNIDGRKMYESLLSYYQKGLPVKDFALALYKVREIEFNHHYIDSINMDDIKKSIINKYLKSILVKAKDHNLPEEEIKDLKIDLYLYLSLNIFPLLDKKDKNIKKLIKKKDDNNS